MYVLSSEWSDDFLHSMTDIHIENACNSDRDELYSTEYIPSCNGERLKKGLSLMTSPCSKIYKGNKRKKISFITIPRFYNAPL